MFYVKFLTSILMLLCKFQYYNNMIVIFIIIIMNSLTIVAQILDLTVQVLCTFNLDLIQF